MNKVIPVFTIACLGAAVASVVAVFRAKQRVAKIQDKDDIQRWEAEGGSAPIKPVAPTTTPY